VTEKPSVEELLGFVEEIKQYKGKDATLEELQEWAEENPELVETAIDLKF
jgi:ABC-type uncharacterized transport system YnjBCD substrate-binding protein